MSSMSQSHRQQQEPLSYQRFLYGVVSGAAISLIIFSVYAVLTQDTVRVGVSSSRDNRSVDVPVVAGMHGLLSQLAAGLAQVKEDVRNSWSQEGGTGAALSGKLKEQLDALQREVEQQSAALKEQLTILEANTARIREMEAIAMLRADYAMETQTEPGAREHYTQGWITNNKPELWQQRKFRRHAAYGFVKYSAYRINTTRVAVLGLAARSMYEIRRLQGCEWHGLAGSGSSESKEGKATGVATATASPAIIKGNLSLFYGKEHHDMMYEVVVLSCDLNEPIREQGGFLQVSIDNEVSYLYWETPDTPLELGKGPFQYDVAFCSAPLVGEVSERLVKEWIEYHHNAVGAGQFLLYDAGAVTPAVYHAIHPYVDAGLVTITNFRQVNMWDIWANGHGLSIFDCSFRLRESARWVVFQTVEEFLETVPPQPLKHFLAPHEGRTAFLSYGCIWLSSQFCTSTHPAATNELSRFLISPVQYGWPNYYCQDKEQDPRKCLGTDGFRRFIADPRKVETFYIHSVEQHEGEGVHLDPDVLRHRHYDGLNEQSAWPCPKGPPDEGWKKYDSINKTILSVIRCRYEDSQQACTYKELGVVVA